MARGGGSRLEGPSGTARGPPGALDPGPVLSGCGVRAGCSPQEARPHPTLLDPHGLQTQREPGWDEAPPPAPSGWAVRVPRPRSGSPATVAPLAAAQAHPLPSGARPGARVLPRPLARASAPRHPRPGTPRRRALTLLAVLPAEPERALAEVRAPPADASAAVLTPGPLAEVPLGGTAWEQDTQSAPGAEARAGRGVGCVPAPRRRPCFGMLSPVSDRQRTGGPRTLRSRQNLRPEMPRRLGL